MKKSTPYGRKKSRDQIAQANQRKHEMTLAKFKEELRGMQIDAGVHTWAGADGQRMVDLCGRLIYITLFAAVRAGFQAVHPDVRIVRGMSEALADLAADTDAIERYRPSLQSGLAAIDRLIAECDDIDLVQGSIELDTMLAVKNFGTADVRKLIGVEA